MKTNPHPLEHYPVIHRFEVRFRDLDALGHVNNAVYLTYFEMARVAYYTTLIGTFSLDQIDIVLAEINVSFHAPAHLGDTLAVGVRVSSISRKSFVMEYTVVCVDDNRLIASGRSVQVTYDHAARRSKPVSDNFREQVRALQGNMPPRKR